MDAGLTRRAFAIFEEALETGDAERDAYLATACAGDAALLEEVRRLFNADAMAERAMPTGGLQPHDEPMPSRIGRYRIVERIGQGGMGDVYAGARDDGLFEHAVAIKRVRPTPFAQAARALFERERRALAALSHRHIAQLYDGGVDDGGAPYLIMELVRGVAIDDYCHARDFPPRRIVEMMIAICEAAQHAHQNLIVHADLKPANILVNEVGDPKVVDFGVARLLGETSDAGLYPQTPGYASPQREAGAMPTPADDVFALGAVLRALLTGEAPRSAAPTLPASQAIERSAVFADRPSQWRNARARAVHGDLDAIILHACMAEAEQRYPAAVTLAADLRAWLDFRPISSRTNDRVYVFQQFVRRRRWRVIGGVVAAFGLIAALTVTSILYAQADSARRDAETRFTEVRSLAKYVVSDLYDRLERMPQTLALRRDAARVAQRYMDALAETPSASAVVLQEAAEGLVRIADLQAGRSRANLGEVDAALENLSRANLIASRIEVLKPGDPGVAALRAGIEIRHAAIAMNSQQDFDTATRLLESAGQDISVIPVGSPGRAVLTVQHDLETAILGNWKGTYADSVIHAQRAIDVATAPPADPADARDLPYLLARAWDAKAEAIYYEKGAAASESTYRRLVELTSAYASQHSEDMLGIRLAIEAHWALGVTLLGIDRAKDGLAELDAASALLPVLLKFQPDDDGAKRTQHIVLSARAQALAMAGRFKEGVALLREQVDISDDLVRQSNNLPASVRSQAVTLSMLADLYDDNGIYKESCLIYARADAIFSDLDKHGELSPMDRDSSLKMIRERQAKHCT